MDLTVVPVILIAVIVAVAVLALVAAVRAFVGGRDEVIQRLERSVQRPGPSMALLAQEETGAAATLAARMLRPFAWIARPRQAEQLGRLRQRLVQAGFRGEHALEILLGTKIVLAPLLVIAFLQLNARRLEPIGFPLDVIIASWFCALGFWSPDLWLRGKITERRRSIERTLPDALDLLVACVEAGLGIDAALHRVAEELTLAAPVLGEELETTFLEVQAGLPRSDGFRRLADRTGVEDLRSLSAMLIQTEMFGTSLSRALRVQAESIRVRRMQRAEERAGTVAVKLTIPLILLILPALVAVIMGPAVITIGRAFGG